MVTDAKLPGRSSLALLSAALVMVLALAGGGEPRTGSSRDLGVGALKLSLFSPMPDDAQIGSDRTVLQISAPRAGAAVPSTEGADARRLPPVVGAITLLLLAVRMHSTPQLTRPSLRGPPPA